VALTREGFEALLKQLGGEPEAPRRYEEIRRRLIRLFEWRGCEAPEDLADETIDRVARRLAGGLVVESGDPYRYFCGVAHRVYLEVLRARRRERLALERESWTPPPDPAEDEESPERLDCLRRCLGQLSAEQAALILDYHREDRGAGKIEARKRLAGRLGLPINALRIRAHRIRRGLEGCIGECLAASGSRFQPAAAQPPSPPA
jgi:DNA-directed RNA polymerase specialized sigma24 family protein